MKVELSNEEIIALRIAIAKSTLIDDLSKRNECNTPLAKTYKNVSYRIRELCDKIWHKEEEQNNHKN